MQKIKISSQAKNKIINLLKKEPNTYFTAGRIAREINLKNKKRVEEELDRDEKVFAMNTTAGEKIYRIRQSNWFSDYILTFRHIIASKY